MPKADWFSSCLHSHYMFLITFHHDPFSLQGSVQSDHLFMCFSLTFLIFWAWLNLYTVCLSFKCTLILRSLQIKSVHLNALWSSVREAHWDSRIKYTTKLKSVDDSHSFIHTYFTHGIMQLFKAHVIINFMLSSFNVLKWNSN